MHRFRAVARKITGLLLAGSMVGARACGDDAARARRGAVTPPPPAAAAIDAGLTAKGRTGHHRANAKWVPGEHKAGMRKWRDAGVYVDGKPLGVIWFGELPARLKPVWIEQERDLEFKAGDPGPRTATFKERRYRIAEYLEALGVDLARVREVHIYGGKGFPARVAGKELRRVRDTLQLGFGRQTHGKPLIYFPADLRTNTSFDHIAAIAVYIDKKPPKLRDDGDLELDGQPVYDLPYFGDPLRGGVRVYKDDRLAAWIKRRKLAGAAQLAEQGADGSLRWKLLPFLAAQGVDVDSVVLADLIYDERRVQRLDRAALDAATFTADPQSSGQIMFGGDKPVQAIALHSEPIPPPVDPDAEQPE